MFLQVAVEDLTGNMFQEITTQLYGVVPRLELKAWTLLVVAVVAVTLAIRLLMEPQQQMEAPREQQVDAVDPAS
jgi:putative exporter of polyketide antibiotics